MSTIAQAPSPPRRGLSLWAWLGIIVGGLLLLLLALGFALTLPRVQTWAGKQVAAYFSKKTGFETKMDRLHIDFQERRLTVHNLTTTDLQGRRMFDLPFVAIRFTYDSLLRRNVTFDSVFLPRGIVRIVTNEDIKATNITQFVDTIQSWVNGPPKGPGDTVGAGARRLRGPAIFRIHKGRIKQFRVVVSNESRDTVRNGIDYNHLYFVEVDGLIRNLRARSDTMDIDVRRLSTRDSVTGWPIHHIATHFHLDRHKMAFTQMKLRAGRSYLAHTLIFKFEKQKDLGDFDNKVYVEADLKRSRVDSRDLALFAHDLTRFHEIIHADHLEVKGGVKDFTVGYMDLRFGGKSHIVGRMRLRGLPSFDDWSVIDARLKPSFVQPEDLRQYIPDTTAIGYLTRFGPAQIEGSFDGTRKQFSIKAGAHNNANGTLRVDMVMHLLGKDNKDATYKGTFRADTLAAGRLVGRKFLGPLSAQGTVDGQGLDLKTARLKLDIKVHEVRLAKIPVRNFRIDGTLDKHKFWNLLGALRL